MIHGQLKQATFDIQRQQFNTVASAAMKILNVLDDPGLAMFDPSDQIRGSKENTRKARDAVYKEGISILLRVLSPITPHISQTLWKELGFGTDIVSESWPEADEGALVQDEIELVLQVNGKVRGKLTVSALDSAESVEILARGTSIAVKYSEGKTIKKVIVVPRRLVNISCLAVRTEQWV